MKVLVNEVYFIFLLSFIHEIYLNAKKLGGKIKKPFQFDNKKAFKLIKMNSKFILALLLKFFFL